MDLPLRRILLAMLQRPPLSTVESGGRSSLSSSHPFLSTAAILPFDAVRFSALCGTNGIAEMASTKMRRPLKFLASFQR